VKPEPPNRSPELQAQIDKRYTEWRKSRTKWKAPRGKWHAIINELRRVDIYRFVPKTPLTEKELLSLRAAVHASRASGMYRWSVRREGGSVVIQRIGSW
jgi:hypothetical protein